MRLDAICEELASSIPPVSGAGGLVAELQRICTRLSPDAAFAPRPAQTSVTAA
jgi:hypothetical protein